MTDKTTEESTLLKDGFDQPQKISGVQKAFPANLGKLMPPHSTVPDEFKDGYTEWNKFVSSWFFSGWPEDRDLVIRPGVDPQLAHDHLSTILRSYEPKHEHKEAAVAWLLSRWFLEIREIA